MFEHRIVSALSVDEFREVMREIELKHCLIKGRCVKYVDSSFDFRTMEYWRIVIRPFGEEKEFTVTNRYTGDSNYDNLYDEIMEYLNVEK